MRQSFILRLEYAQWTSGTDQLKKTSIKKTALCWNFGSLHLFS